MMKKIYIEGMTCGHCARRVEEALKGVAGITDAKVDLPGKYAEAEMLQEVDNESIKAAVEDAGYEVVEIR